ncbi:unnamed protein product [Orchesella dallaii]|uniref:Uncharacterized protein n=1 Tax=Orchesella dallaii TaxID=48710 RepID=A0ABP1RH85_9HEXA
MKPTMNTEEKNKKLEEWLGGQFRGLKTYADAGDPRKYILPALLLKYVTSALLTSETFGEELKSTLRKKLRGYNCMQGGYQDVFEDQIANDELRLLNSLPVVWMCGILSGYGCDEIIELLQLTDADVERTEADATEQEVIQIN